MEEKNSDFFCEKYLFIHSEVFFSKGIRAFLYFCALAYCFIGLSVITARFFCSMENIVKQTREIAVVNSCTITKMVRHERVWNYTIADISLLAFGTSFPQISLAIIDAIQNIGQLNAGGLGPGTLVGSAAFDLFPIHAVCVIAPKMGELKKISDIGVWLVELFWSFWAYIWLYIILEVWTPEKITIWEASLTVLQFFLLLLHAYAQDKRWPYLSIPIESGERPEEWVPREDASSMPNGRQYGEFSSVYHDSEDFNNIVDIFSFHSGMDKGAFYHNLPDNDMAESSIVLFDDKNTPKRSNLLSLWGQQFSEALKLESTKPKKLNNICLRSAKIFWQLLLTPWSLLFALVPPYEIAHGWIAFICSLIFISGIAFVVTILTDLISCVTGINSYVIAFTALAAGTSWPDLVASKIAAERQITADSAIANITCSNSVNIYIGIGIPWLIDTSYNFVKYRQPLYIQNTAGLSFSLLVFFATSFICITILVLRRLILGAELGGPRLCAWITAACFILLWLVFVVLSSLKVSGYI